MQRLYESVQDNADEAAERALGIFGQDCLDLQEQASNINKIISRYTNDNHLANSLQAEKDFLKASKKLYNILEKNDELTLGLDDLIMSIASKHEEAVYLLQQTLSNIES